MTYLKILRRKINTAKRLGLIGSLLQIKEKFLRLFFYFRILGRKINTVKNLGFIGSLSRIKSCFLKPFFLKNFGWFDQLLQGFLLSIDKSKIERIPLDKQIFLIGRHDYGGVLCTLHYAALWIKARGEIVIIITSINSYFADSLARILCPTAQIINLTKRYRRIFSFFKNHPLFLFTVQKLYSFVISKRPNALFLWDNQPIPIPSSYNVEFDEFLPLLRKKSEEFLEAYCHFRTQYCIREDCWKDYSDLLINNEKILRHNSLKNKLKNLFRHFGIDRPYVILHLSSEISGHNLVSDRRRIYNPERYNTLIDSLIEKGFDVVLHGRKEQPFFKQRNHFFDYSKSTVCSPENDLAFFSGAYFVISSKTGPDMFCQPYHIPLMGINYTERALLIPHVQYRYFYKHIQEPSGKYLSWKELLDHPVFYEFGSESFSNTTRDLVFEEMSEKELLEALEEFLPIVGESQEKWLEFSELQKAYLGSLAPYHFDLYNFNSVPFNCYLTSEKSRDQLLVESS